MAVGVDLFWLPLGAGEGPGVVRWSGRLYEALTATYERRERCDLYHSALEVELDAGRFVIEMTPVWGNGEVERGVVAEGPVGLAVLGRSRAFRYEVRRWRDGMIPDGAEAVDSPLRLSADVEQARRVLDLVPAFPTLTWGRDPLDSGDMWNSNSLISWLLASSGHDVGSVQMPRHGRAPGWTAGLVAASRETTGLPTPRSREPGRCRPSLRSARAARPRR